MASQDYYNGGAPQNNGYGEPYQTQQVEAKYQQPPPQYGQTLAPNYGGYDPAVHGEKPSFDQAFKVEKPKWNDLWAGILVRRECAIHDPNLN